MSLVDDAERAYARAVRALLRGEAPDPLPGLLGARNAELEERSTAGDIDARFALAVQASVAALPERVARAVAAESAAVVLADGSSLSLDDAERQLARKEERRAHPALRTGIDRALDPFAAASSALVQYFLSDRNEDEARRAALTTFLHSTHPLRDAARDALAALGGEPLETPAALARALDLVDVDGAFAESTCLALVAGARDAARPSKRIARLRAPRAMAGAVFADDEVRFAHPSGIARWSRFHATVMAGVAAICAADDVGRSRSAPASSPAAIAGAVTASLVDAASRRRMGAQKAVAERAARIHAATSVLAARANAALALAANPTSGEPTASVEARERLVDALGSDPGPALTSSLLGAPWVVVVDPVENALAKIDGPCLVLAMRDRFDETFALEPATWASLRDGELSGSIEDAPRAWFTLVGERL
jgi:hypothetical protein